MMMFNKMTRVLLTAGLMTLAGTSSSAMASDFTFGLADAELTYVGSTDDEDSQESLTVEFRITEDLEEDEDGTLTDGLEFAVAHDEDYLEAASIELTGKLADLNDGDGPE